MSNKSLYIMEGLLDHEYSIPDPSKPDKILVYNNNNIDRYFFPLKGKILNYRNPKSERITNITNKNITNNNNNIDRYSFPLKEKKLNYKNTKYKIRKNYYYYQY